MTVVGIDLGTTNSVVACAQPEQMVVATDPRGNQIHPSVIALLSDGTKLFSHEAAARRIIDPKYTIYSAKRLIGQPFKSALVREAATRIPYQVAAGNNDQAVIVGPDRTYTVPELSGALLLYLRQCAELYLSDSVRAAVLTVPANFNDSQRRATMDAGRIAGLDVLRVINEPTAAALAYGLGRNMSQRIAVYDFGGGTFDVTILQVEGDVFEVLASGGDSFLGGDDIDLTLVGMLAARCIDEHGVDPRSDPTTRARLTVAAEQIKRHLSTNQEARGALSGLILPNGQQVDIPVSVSRDDFDVAILPLICRTIECCDQVLSLARLTKSQIDEVILVGGTTRVPLVRHEVAQAFGRAPRSDIDPDLVVAWGAAIQADNLSGPGHATRPRRPVLLDVTPHALGIAVAGGFAEPIVERNAQVPIEQTRLFTTSGDNQRVVRIQVCQGESRRFDENTPLGDLELTGLPAERRGQVRIEVTFRIDTNGILRVRARDPVGGAMQQAAVSVRGTMTEAEVAAAAARALEDLPAPLRPSGEKPS